MTDTPLAPRPGPGENDQATSRIMKSGGEPSSTRRQALKWVIRAAYGAFAVAFAVPALALRSLTQDVLELAAGDRLVHASGNLANSPVNADDIAPGTAVQAFPEGKTEDSKNLVEVVRLPEAPDTVVAYSAICTHLGCSVLPTLTEEGLIICPCHASIFDPANNGEVRSGPAGKPLPALEISVEDDGSIVATSGFNAPVGPN